MRTGTWVITGQVDWISALAGTLGGRALILAIDLSNLGVGCRCGWTSRRGLGLWGVGGRICWGGVLRLSVGGGRV